MKTIIYNDDNLTKKDIDEKVIRVKALIINENNEIIIGKSDSTYQFPGGHVEKNETLEEALIREVKEESGIILNKENRKPFFKIEYYTKNYYDTKLNVLNDIYYYVVYIDKDVEIGEICLTDDELINNYHLEGININNVINYLEGTINKISKITDLIVRDMIDAIKEYINNK